MPKSQTLTYNNKTEEIKLFEPLVISLIIEESGLQVYDIRVLHQTKAASGSYTEIVSCQW